MNTLKAFLSVVLLSVAPAVVALSSTWTWADDASLDVAAVPIDEEGNPIERESKSEKAKIVTNLEELNSRIYKHAYAPIKYSVENRTDKPYYSKLNISDGYSSGRNNQQNLSVLTPPHCEKSYYFYPTLTKGYMNVQSTDKPSAHCYINTIYGSGAIAVSSECRESWGGVSSVSRSSSFDTTTFVITNWPADYRTFASFDLLIIPEKQYHNKLDESYRKAIRLWVAAGGHLLLVSDASAKESTKRFGHGKSTIAPQRLNMDADDRDKWLMKLMYLGGEKEDSNFPQYNAEPQKRIFPEISDLSKYMVSPPPAFLGLILFAFAIFVGPICLKVLAPVGKRFRLFYIMPISALAVTLLLTLLIFVIDGTGGTGTRKVHFVINAADHTGLIIQTQAVRTNLLLSDEFHLPAEVSISGERNTSTSYKEDLENCQRDDDVCSGGYFPSRAAVIHYLLQPVVTRWALIVEKTEDGKYAFQSKFPNQLTNVIYTAEDGKVWAVESLAPGQKLVAKPVQYMGKFKPTAGSFRAVLADSDGQTGVIPTLDSIEWEETEIIVSGPIAFNN